MNICVFQLIGNGKESYISWRCQRKWKIAFVIIFSFPRISNIFESVVSFLPPFCFAGACNCRQFCHSSLITSSHLIARPIMTNPVVQLQNTFRAIDGSISLDSTEYQTIKSFRSRTRTKKNSKIHNTIFLTLRSHS